MALSLNVAGKFFFRISISLLTLPPLLLMTEANSWR